MELKDDSTIYLTRDGREVMVTLSNNENCVYPYIVNCIEDFNDAWSCTKMGVFDTFSISDLDIVAIKTEQQDNPVVDIYDIIIDITAAFQQAGGSGEILKKITLKEFLEICVKNNIEISAKYKESK